MFLLCVPHVLKHCPQFPSRSCSHHCMEAHGTPKVTCEEWCTALAAAIKALRWHVQCYLFTWIIFLQDFARLVFMVPLIVNQGYCSALWCHQQLVETSLYVYFKPAGAVTCDQLLVTSYWWPVTCDQLLVTSYLWDRLLVRPVTCETCYLWPVTCGSMPAYT